MADTEGSGSNGVPRRHIVVRPRLVRLLDHSEARIIMLVAPAGYGKTTLAHQWLADKRHVWYQATSASRDVAALVAGIARAAADVTRVDIERVRRHLERTPDPEAEVRVLADLSAESFAAWPADAWLVIDDYHFLVESDPAESVLQTIADVPSTNLMILSRTRPTWATARRLLYGELFELGRHDLAMDAEEADRVLVQPRERSASGLVALAEGWPAVIGLASLADDSAAPENAIGGALYDFFAEELFRGLTHARRIQFSQLAVAPTVDADLAAGLFGDGGASALDEATRSGFLSCVDRGWSMHPLLRTFLLMKFTELSEEKRLETTSTLFGFLMKRRDWDSAFQIVERFDLPDLVERLIASGATEMFAAGRVATLRRWVQQAQRSPVSAPFGRALEAEIAFRQGSHAAAEALAADAARELPRKHALRQRALLRAGQAANFAERYEEALSYLQESSEAGADPSLVREARWMAFVASVDSERPDALDFLRRFEDVRGSHLDDALRMSTARLLLAVRRGGLREALRSEAPSTYLVDRAADPMIRTSFWNVYGSAVALNARYEAALVAAQQERREGKARDLAFVFPHADLLEALGNIGLRKFDRAASFAHRVFAFADEHDDVYLWLTAKAIRARLLIGVGSPVQAVAETVAEPAFPQSSIRLVYGEYVSVRALALAAVGASRPALKAIESVLGSSRNAESISFAHLARAIALHRDGRDADEAANDALNLVRRLGHFDCLVTAYRACPQLVDLALRTGHQELIEDVLRRSNDVAIARQHGLLQPAPGTTLPLLSPREAQVLDLVAGGRTNEEVAQLLFISAVTVKAHLRHIYEKLGVRNRVEATALIREKQQTATR